MPYHIAARCPCFAIDALVHNGPEHVKQTPPPPSACRPRSWHRPSSAPLHSSALRRCHRHSGAPPRPCQRPAHGLDLRVRGRVRAAGRYVVQRSSACWRQGGAVQCSKQRRQRRRQLSARKRGTQHQGRACAALAERSSQRQRPPAGPRAGRCRGPCPGWTEWSPRCG